MTLYSIHPPYPTEVAKPYTRVPDVVINGVILARDCYDERGAPIKCCHCLSTDIRHRVVGTISYGQVCEAYDDCNYCGKTIGFWAYGHYDPGYDPYFNPPTEEQTTWMDLDTENSSTKA